MIGTIGCDECGCISLSQKNCACKCHKDTQNKHYPKSEVQNGND